MKTNSKILFSALLPLALLVSGCSDDEGVVTSTESGNGSLSVSYQNARNGNALIEFAANSSFPSTPIVDASKSTAGYFYQVALSCVGDSIPLTFTLKNNGTGTLRATSSPVVTFTDTTTYNSGAGNPSDYSYTLSTPPTFPLAAGQSTNFTMTLFTGHTPNCRFGEVNSEGGDAVTAQKIEMVVHTDDSTNPSYSVDMVILGNS